MHFPNFIKSTNKFPAIMITPPLSNRSRESRITAAIALFLMFADHL